MPWSSATSPSVERDGSRASWSSAIRLSRRQLQWEQKHLVGPVPPPGPPSPTRPNCDRIATELRADVRGNEEPQNFRSPFPGSHSFPAPLQVFAHTGVLLAAEAQAVSPHVLNLLYDLVQAVLQLLLAILARVNKHGQNAQSRQSVESNLLASVPLALLCTSSWVAQLTTREGDRVGHGVLRQPVHGALARRTCKQVFIKLSLRHP
jgi:hypothetical protein